MNVDRRWWGASVVRGRVLAAGLFLLGAGCAVLGVSRSRMPVANTSVPSLLASAGQDGIAPASSTTSSIANTSHSDAQTRARSLLAGLPLVFEPNLGQGNLDPADPRARFVTRGPGYSLFLGADGAILSLVSQDRSSQDHSRRNSIGREASASARRVESLHMKLVGANSSASLTATDLLLGKSNYFLGNDPARWRTGVPHFSRVRYENIYPGINLVFYGNQGQLEYDFQVAPGSDPAQAQLEFDGAKHLELSEGALIIKGEGGNIRLDAPRVYQEIGGRHRPIEGRFVVRGANRAGFAIGAYDHSRELIIDPILNFSTYFGGSGDEHSTSVAVDGSLNVYLAGSTTSPDLPAIGVFQPALNGSGPDVYIAKITPPLGSNVATLDYVTYLGGDAADTPVGIKVDGRGDPFVAGTTSSSNFPTTATNAYQTAPEPGSPGPHAFVSELKFDGTVLLYSSYLSGNGTDIASGMTIDPAGSIYVTGTTTSSDAASTTDQFPASTVPQKQAYQAAPRAPIQFFVTKVDTAVPRTGSIVFSTYFGGGNFDTASPIAIGGGIDVDITGNIYFSGTTNFLYTGCSGCGTTDFPILNAFQPCLDQAPPTTITNPPSCTTTTTTTASDAFVAKLNPTGDPGQQLLWSTYLGGTGTDSSTGVALDTGAANVYVVGTTDSTDIGSSITTLSNSAAYQRCLDTQINPPAGTACTTPSPLANDAFVARLSNPATTVTTTTNVALNYFSYLGGSADEAGLAITVDSASGALVTGWTQSTDFPVLGCGPLQCVLNPPQDAFVARLNTTAVVGQAATASWASYFGGSGTDSGTGIALDVNQNSYLAGETNSTDLHVAKPLPADTNNNGGYDAFVAQLATALSLSINGTLTQGTNQNFVSAGTQATFTYTVTNTGPDLATNITVTDNLSSQVTGVALTLVSASVTSGTCGGASTNAIVSCSLPSLQSGSTATVTVVVTPTANSNGSSPQVFNGGTVQAMGPGNIVLAQTSVPATMSDFNISISPSSQSVSVAGGTAKYQVTLIPRPIFTTNISLSCSNLPSGAACNFTNNPATLSTTSGATSTLNLTTTARPIVTPAASLFTRHFYAFWLMLPGLTLLGIGGGHRRRRIAGILMMCFLFTFLLLLPACSKSTTQTPVSGTPAGTYTVTVTASANSDTKSGTVTLVVP